DGQSLTFNSSGQQTQWSSADGNETLAYRYDGSSRLDGITAIDAALTSFTYSSGSVAIQTVNSRTTTLTLDLSGNLTAITNPDAGVQSLTYDASHYLTRDQFGMLEQNWEYTGAGVLNTATDGGAGPGGLTNPTVN